MLGMDDRRSQYPVKFLVVRQWASYLFHISSKSCHVESKVGHCSDAERGYQVEELLVAGWRLGPQGTVQPVPRGSNDGAEGLPNGA